MQGFVQTKHLGLPVTWVYNSKSFIKAEGVVSRILMDTPSGKERIAPLIYWSKGILREDMQEFLIGKLCPDTSISELFKLLHYRFFPIILPNVKLPTLRL